MKDNTKKFDPELYKGTYKYYIKYRPPIPKEVIDIIVGHFDVKPTDRVLDLGCGTGQVALAMEGKSYKTFKNETNLVKLCSRGFRKDQKETRYFQGSHHLPRI
ncbi:MAG: hypothetical protein NC925_03235 [Candidatus Omnitrophica bacterium]|nr:hypothetical protein [Candidatus Omnitrophota bacterium]